MQAAARSAIRTILSRPPPLGGGGRPLSSSSAAAAVAAACLDKQEVTDRVLAVLKSTPFIDPAKVGPAADFKKDLQLDMLDNIEVMTAVEEEFAFEIPGNEAIKISTTAHLIDYIASNPQAK